MQCICEKHCIIGEGPIWNEREQLLYFVDALNKEICSVDIASGTLHIRCGIGAAAIAFDVNNRMVISTRQGVFYLNNDNSVEDIYDGSKYQISVANDMKVGPDGRIYVGTQSSKRAGISDQIDGKLYSIDKSGNVKILLDNLILSNGMDWSMDENYYYHTDSDTNIIKEYAFDKEKGNLRYTGRSVCVPGVDGFTMDKNDNLYAACWGRGHIAVVDTKSMQVKEYIKVPADIPASCGFCGSNMDMLAVTTASYEADISKDSGAGYTFIKKGVGVGRKPYLFG